jgi:hypothetical protein
MVGWPETRKRACPAQLVPRGFMRLALPLRACAHSRYADRSAVWRGLAKGATAAKSAQARGGPCDTEYLFDSFIDMARTVKEKKTWTGADLPIPAPEAAKVQDLRSGFDALVTRCPAVLRCE